MFISNDSIELAILESSVRANDIHGHGRTNQKSAHSHPSACRPNPQLGPKPQDVNIHSAT